jgi:hypothetical protein
MSATIPTCEPAKLRAGETLQFIKTLTDYPADASWVINYSLRGLGGSKIDFSSVASGKDHAVNVAFGITTAWLPGIYRIVGVVTDGTTSKAIYTGQIEILPNLATMDGGTDTRTPNRIALDNVRAVLAGRANSTILKSEVEGTTLERIPHSELIKLETNLAIKVRDEEIAELQAQGKSTGRTIYAQFTRPR